MTVDFDALELAFMAVNTAPQYSSSAIISRASGQIYVVSEHGESDELPDDVDNPELYIEIPHKNELDLGVALVRAFVPEHIPQYAAQVEAFFRSRGAYARFKGLLRVLGILDSWYRFEEEQTTFALQNWCEKNGIKLSNKNRGSEAGSG